MKKLFVVKRIGKGSNPLVHFFTDSKQHAKLIRNAYGGFDAGYYVSLGPDHWRKQ